MFENYFTFIITFYFSFLVSIYVSDNFKYSSLYIIRLNQKFAISIITIFLSIIVVFYIMDFVDIINHILCEGSDSVKKLVDSINGSNKLVSDYNLEYFYEYLNSLSLLELSALYHIIVLVVIAIFSINVLSAV
jgi:hypothetical protein